MSLLMPLYVALRSTEQQAVFAMMSCHDGCQRDVAAAATPRDMRERSILR